MQVLRNTGVYSDVTDSECDIDTECDLYRIHCQNAILILNVIYKSFHDLYFIATNFKNVYLNVFLYGIEIE